MKKLAVILFVLVGMLNFGIVMAQSVTPTQSRTSVLKGLPNGKVQTTGPNMHAVNLRIRSQIQQMHEDLKSGKLTNDQAKAIMIKLKSARQLELKYFRENNQREINTDQKSQIDAVLDQNKSSL